MNSPKTKQETFPFVRFVLNLVLDMVFIYEFDQTGAAHRPPLIVVLTLSLLPSWLQPPLQPYGAGRIIYLTII